MYLYLSFVINSGLTKCQFMSPLLTAIHIYFHTTILLLLLHTYTVLLMIYVGISLIIRF